MQAARLFYVADPMCSWCFGFAPQLSRICAGLPSDLAPVWVMGGLAPDSDEPMPAATRDYVQDAWRAVAARTGVEFNWEFWERCEPRRSTWLACRAVLAAEALAPGGTRPMFDRIQRAYYAEARNPSEPETLIELALELGYEREAFAAALTDPATQGALERDFALRDELGASGFPSLLLRSEGRTQLLMRGWAPASEVLATLERIVTSGGK